MLRHFTLLLLTPLLLTGCDKLLEAALKEGESGSLDSQIQINSESKPEIVAAFDAISRAARAHNTVLVEQMEKNEPANGPASSAGIAELGKAAREHGGLAKQIIEAAANAAIYEKDIFIVFDTMHKQFEGMKTQGGSGATQRRAYVRIYDSGIRTYDKAITHLERGQEPLLRLHFDKKKVPREISEEFLRLRRIGGAKANKFELEMFKEGRAALQSYRTAMTQTDQAKWNAHVAEAKQHDQKSNRARQQMIAELRKTLGSSTVL